MTYSSPLPAIAVAAQLLSATAARNRVSNHCRFAITRAFNSPHHFPRGAASFGSRVSSCRTDRRPDSSLPTTCRWLRMRKSTSSARKTRPSARSVQACSISRFSRWTKGKTRETARGRLRMTAPWLPAPPLACASPSQARSRTTFLQLPTRPSMATTLFPSRSKTIWGCSSLRSSRLSAPWPQQALCPQHRRQPSRLHL